MPEVKDSEVVLKVEHLKKYFPMGKHAVLKAVDDVSFEMKRGETLGIVGESGCGKTTCGRTVIGLYNKTDGAVLYKGKDVHAMKGNERKAFTKEVQMIFQDPYASLDPRLKVNQIVGEGMRIHKMYSSNAEIQDRVFELLDQVGLNREHASRYVHEFSGGQRQRIGIARALALDPEFILCDEPISALDVSIQAQILNLMQDLQEQSGLTYIFITHDLSVVKHISDEICVMYLGNLVEKCPSDKLFEKQLHPYSQALLSAIPVAKTDAVRNRIILKGEISSPIDPAPGCRFASRCLYAKPECFKTQPEFKEVEPEHFVACHLFD
mgnify:CR=1 FL=1